MYRPEIDGLRAIAVMSVIFFHAGFNWIKGGFVGVDIFFVISGYLITNLLIREKLASTFSYLEFYERRIRRIIPALFLVIFVSTIAAWFLLAPGSYKNLGKTIVLITSFVSNIFFSLKNNYFDSTTDIQPLHHTWSLSVEEQFYLIFPLILVLFLRWNKKVTGQFIVASIVASLILTEYARRHHPLPGFYLIQTRAWELLFGSLVAIIANSNFKLNKTSRNIASITGLLAICGAIFFLDVSKPFPSLYALLPVGGTALIILCTGADTVVAKLLSLRILVTIGLISYSSYLWHQPIFAYFRIYNVNPLTTTDLTFLILTTLILAYLTWKFVEQPFRDRSRIATKTIYISYALGSIFLILLGLSIYYNNGFECRVAETKQQILNFGNNYSQQLPNIYQQKTCFLMPDQDKKHFRNCLKTSDKNSVLIWGDSHAAHLLPGMKKHWSDSFDINNLSASGCAPLLGEDFSGHPYCKEINNYIYDQIKQHRPNVVFLSAAWGQYNWHKIEKTIHALKQIGINVVVVGPSPDWTIKFTEIIAAQDVLFEKVPYYFKEGLVPNFFDIDKEMQAFAVQNKVNYISTANILCSDYKCKTRGGDKLEDLYYWDCDHLTVAGSEFLVSHFKMHNQS